MAKVIVDHNNPTYVSRRPLYGPDNEWDGELCYSMDIVNGIAPNVTTDRPFITVGVRGECVDGAVFFIHNNVTQTIYSWLSAYKDLILVCGVKSTCDKVKHLGRPIYLPLSIDTILVESYKREKDRDVCAFGRPEKMRFAFPDGTVKLPPMPRYKALAEVARYRRCYAVGRCAIEARALGCEILPYDPRYPDPSIWNVVDVIDAARILQSELDAIDGK